MKFPRFPGRVATPSRKQRFLYKEAKKKIFLNYDDILLSHTPATLSYLFFIITNKRVFQRSCRNNCDVIITQRSWRRSIRMDAKYFVHLFPLQDFVSIAYSRILFLCLSSSCHFSCYCWASAWRKNLKWRCTVNLALPCCRTSGNIAKSSMISVWLYLCT